MNELHVIGKERIGNFEFIAIEGGFGNGKKALTVKDIAGIHGKEVKVINQAINMNRYRFTDGMDIVDLKSVVNQIDLEKFGFTQNAINRSNNIYILSERGYFKLLKILEDDTAWEIYDQLVDNYFSMRQQVQIPTTSRDLVLLALSAGEETNQRVDELGDRVAELEENTVLSAGDYGYISRRISQRVAEVARGFGKLTSEQRGKLHKDIN